jgi:hypothetical protein
MEYINRSDLLGFSGLNEDTAERIELNTLLRRKIGDISTSRASNKAKFEQMMYRLDEPTIAALQKGDLQLVDQVYYMTRHAAGERNFLLVEPKVNSSPGITNIDRAVIPANRWVLLCGMQLLTAVSSLPTTANYSHASNLVINGEFEFNQGARVVVPNVSCSVFNTKGRSDVLKGYWDEFDPQFLMPVTELKPRLKLPQFGDAQNLCVYLALHCVSVEKG